MQQGYVDITEIDADILGGLIGSEEYVTRLAVRNNNLVTKLYTQFKSARDNTQSKQARRALNKLTDKFSKAIDNAKGGVLVSSIKDYEDEEKENAVTRINEENMQVTAEDSVENARYSKSKPFSEQVDDVLSGKHDPVYDLYISETPEVLQNVGFENKPLLMRNSKIREILDKHEEMSVELLKKIPQAIADPIMIVKSKTHPTESVVVITDIVTDKGEMILPVWVCQDGTYIDVEMGESIRVKTNFVASAYGRNIKNLIEYAINNNEVLFYAKDKKRVSSLLATHGLQLPARLSTTNSTIIIPKAEEKINTFEKNSSNKSSDINERASKADTRKRLEDRVSGDELLDAQDLIEVVKEKGGEVDENGYITLYHRTSAENAEKIRSTGHMKSKEDGLFFSTAKEGYASGYGDAVVEFSIPAEKLILDDIFDNEAHLRFPLKQAGMKNVKPYLITESAVDKSAESDIIEEKRNNTDGGIQNGNKDTEILERGTVSTSRESKDDIREYSRRTREMLKNKGYDSIIYTNDWEGGLSVIAFDNEQFYTVAENGVDLIQDIADRSINERSSKTGRDTVEMSKGEIAKFRANYTSDKVFNKRKISEALNDISLVSKLPADVRNELVQSLWKGFNEHRVYDLYSKVMTERLYATIMQETGFELEGLDTKDEKS